MREILGSSPSTPILVMQFYIHTFGCQQNIADSERIAGYYRGRGFEQASDASTADVAIVNTCVIRQTAEDKAYGLIRQWGKQKASRGLKIVVTGCLVGAAAREPSGARLKKLHEQLPEVDEFVPIEEIGFEYTPLRSSSRHALVPISQGCNNFCTFCIVPFSRGKEISRPFADIITEIQDVARRGYTEITLLGQNVNSYGSDLIREAKNNKTVFVLPNGREVQPVYVKHLGRQRIPTLFPYLLEAVANIPGLQNISYISANPWDYSDELINVIARCSNISRVLHLPLQSGADDILRRMNRWYTAAEYANVVDKIRAKVAGVIFTTDIIVGFPGESQEHFSQTMALAQRVGFTKAFVACYSSRLGTAAQKNFPDDVAQEEKKRRFHLLDELINHKQEALQAPWLGLARHHNLLAPVA